MIRTIVSIVVAAAVAVFVIAQTGAPKPSAPAPPLEHGTMHLRTAIGSFVINKIGDRPIEGTFDIKFTGSVLISGLEGTATPSSGLIQEYSDHGRTVYFGTGSMKLEGRWRKFQWFGRDMTADFNGAGIFRLYGEFDKNLDTGTFWYNDPNRVVPWGQGGRTVNIPNPDAKIINPIERKSGGG